MKPPPSDQIWFGFTSMPDIQFNLESSVGDHKITNGRVALFLISRFKVRSLTYITDTDLLIYMLVKRITKRLRSYYLLLF